MNWDICANINHNISCLWVHQKYWKDVDNNLYPHIGSVYISVLYYIFNFCLKLWSDFHLHVMNLVMAELLICLFGIPVDFVASLQGGWNMGQTMCSLTGFILTVLGKKCYSFLTDDSWKALLIFLIRNGEHVQPNKLLHTQVDSCSLWGSAEFSSIQNSKIQYIDKGFGSFLLQEILNYSDEYVLMALGPVPGHRSFDRLGSIFAWA